MYVCMYVCIYVCLYVCIYVCMYVCMYVCIYVCMYVCMYVCIYVCMYVFMYVCMFVCKYVCMYVFFLYVCMLMWTSCMWQRQSACLTALFGPITTSSCNCSTLHGWPLLCDVTAWSSIYPAVSKTLTSRTVTVTYLGCYCRKNKKLRHAAVRDR
jgi:hypothetical protein